MKENQAQEKEVVLVLVRKPKPYDPTPKFVRQAESLVRVWEIPFLDGEEPPLWFCDDVARFFFVRALAAELQAAFRMGKKAEKRRRKVSAVRRWQRRNGHGE